MRRIISLLAVVAVMALMLAIMAAPAFAAKGGFANDDKNIQTGPGCGAASKTCNENAIANAFLQNCEKHLEREAIKAGEGLPAQCYPS